jgi:AraC-like DNA-binding protein
MVSENGTPAFLHFRRTLHNGVVNESSVVQAERCRTAVECVLPDPGAEIYFNLGPAGRHLFDGSRHVVLAPRAAWVVGPHVLPLLIEKEVARCDIVSVRVRPGVVGQVLGVPAMELRESLVDLDLFWGGDVDEVRDLLQAATDPSARLDIVERFVNCRAGAGANGEVELVRRLCESATQCRSIRELVGAFGISHRRLIALFDRHVGMKPKTFQRVQRLRNVLRLIHSPAPPSWSAIALLCGYFDQAHLINDFHLETGMTPAEYASKRSSLGRGFVPHLLAVEGRQPGKDFQYAGG